MVAQGRTELWLPRARCKSGSCPDFVLRPATLYPHRQYQPDVVAKVAAGVALGGQTPAAAAAEVSASATSARRWTRWVAKLVEVTAALSLAARLQPDVLVGAGIAATAVLPARRALAAQVLHALEHLGEALVRSGVALASTSGLGRLLEWQLRLHGDVIHLVAEPKSFSPGVVLGGL